MFEDGQLLRFNRFMFKNGAKPKPKYFIVLRHIHENLVMASLPTSQNHVPDSLRVEHGCVSIPERCVSAFVFAAGENVTDSFAFPLKTYVYGEQVDEYNLEYIESMTDGYENLGILNSELFVSLCDCLKNSSVIKRKYARML